MLIEKPKSYYDVLIVGGGMVGASFALDLHKRSPELSICIVEAVAIDEQDKQPSFDARSTALSWGTRSIYEAIGLWNQLQQFVTPIEEIQVSDSGHFGVTRLHHSEQATDALGYVIENQDLGKVLNHELLASSGIELLAPAKIQSAQPKANSMSVCIETEQHECIVATELLVLADGGRSPLCKQLGIGHNRESYEQCALITNIGVQLPHANRAFERFTDSGPLAVLPLQSFEEEARCSLVWTVKADAEKALLECKDAEFIEKLSMLFGSRLGTITKLGRRFSFPLILTEAREQIRPHLVLLGNVAHTLHPVAGQGLNLALRDSTCLSTKLASAHEMDQPVGSMQILQQYLDQQTPDQHRAIQFTHQMTRLFSSNSTTKILARKMGLLGLDLVPALRQEFARRAMGTPP